MELEKIMHQNKSQILLLYGLAKKSFFDMNEEERNAAAQKVLERAKEAAFTRGLPIIYGEKGYVIAEYANGSRFIRKNGKDIKALWKLILLFMF